MRCKKVKEFINVTGLCNLSDKIKADIEKHLKTCSECAEDKLLTEKLNRILEIASEDDRSNIIPIDTMRQRLGTVQSERSSRTTLLRPGMVYTGVIAAAVVVFTFIFGGFDSEQLMTYGYEVSLNNVDLILASDDEDVCDMLYSAGLYEAAVDIVGCDTTCNLRIFDLRSREEAAMVVNMFSEINDNKIIFKVKPITIQPI